MDAKIASYISNAVIDMLDAGFSVSILKDHLGSDLDDKNKSFRVGLRNQKNDWFPDFVHEYCHFLQHKEGKFVGKKWLETFKLFRQVERGKRLPRGISKSRIIREMQRMELDSEKRVVLEIERYNLPVDKKRYIQRANAYVFFFNFLLENSRKIYLSTSWDCQEVFNLMPCRFLSRYDRMPTKYKRLIKKLYREEINL
jgi:hypothetical protein